MMVDSTAQVLICFDEHSTPQHSGSRQIQCIADVQSAPVARVDIRYGIEIIGSRAPKKRLHQI